ncbi:MAG: UDP-N-acetylglucosamine 2-epimerase [Gammaproteobacteria bacterium RIFCSPHIGHO2_12_FULL_63_22]|nr:MAG: UDP-N-acetylglucosamine 2-epimerase [Gammaproteobacteria bacterium RIFCSPHIGHO2_12_FULL_63_22]
MTSHPSPGNRLVNLACVVGTRPEAIKMAPVIQKLRSSGWARCHVIATAQHRGLLDQALLPFGISPDIDLDLMTEGQSMPDLCGRMLPALSRAIASVQAEAVLAQGDTASVFCAAQAAYFAQIPFGHVEAGLRTHSIQEPFPEEGFRQMAARLARWHFAPTESAARNLSAEGIADSLVHVTGNTGIDALLSIVSAKEAGIAQHVGPRLILLTAHRRESFGAPMAEIFSAVRQLADAHPDVRVVYPVHPNPNVAGLARSLLGGHARIDLVTPMDYPQFTATMQSCFLILTDSGGIQEEAPALGKPVLVLRDQTERPEAIDAGVARLVGTDAARIVAEVGLLLDDSDHYGRMAAGGSPYGDGHAAERIVQILKTDLRPDLPA